MVALVVSERLSVEELRDAARWEHRGKVRARLLAMARLREGGERSATARQFGMSRNVLRIWVGRYNATGIEGLVDRHGGGAPARLTAEQRHALKERVLAGADLERDEIVGKRMYGLSPVKLDKCGHAERILTDRDEPRRASQLDAKLASQPCIRLDRLLPALTNYALLRYSY